MLSRPTGLKSSGATNASIQDAIGDLAVRLRVLGIRLNGRQSLPDLRADLASLDLFMERRQFNEAKEHFAG